MHFPTALVTKSLLRVLVSVSSSQSDWLIAVCPQVWSELMILYHSVRHLQENRLAGLGTLNLDQLTARQGGVFLLELRASRLEALDRGASMRSVAL